ncbi:hypothetical protein Afil01_17530 [Actinorhabdospora filicis]|uniref:Uncharacterized protein n=1 Tax=Actinorhabdospora filicis TaxID=1785913 RepID=A0A9W6SLT8_9ACTN|nr:hypothetical protein Afil01_17530 [Actinorhabdospora filicis]
MASSAACAIPAASRTIPPAIPTVLAVRLSHFFIAYLSVLNHCLRRLLIPQALFCGLFAAAAGAAVPAGPDARADGWADRGLKGRRRSASGPVRVGRGDVRAGSRHFRPCLAHVSRCSLPGARRGLRRVRVGRRHEPAKRSQASEAVRHWLCLGRYNERPPEKGTRP